MNRLPSVQLMLFWVGMLLLSSAALAFMIWTIRNNAMIIQSLHIEIQQEIQKNQILTTFKKIAQDSIVEQKKINSYLVNKDSTVSFIEKIESLGVEQNVKIEIRSVDTKVIPDQNRNILVLDVGVEGEWQRVMRILNLIAIMPHKIVIQNLNLTQKQVSDEESLTSRSVWNASFTINVAMSK